MADNMLMFDGKYYCMLLASTSLTSLTDNELNAQAKMEDNFDDMDPRADGDDEEDDFDDEVTPDDVNESSFGI